MLITSYIDYFIPENIIWFPEISRTIGMDRAVLGAFEQQSPHSN